MKLLSITLSLFLILATGVSTLSAQAADVEGGNALVQKVLSATPLADGTMLLSVRSTGFSWTMDDEAPIGNGSILCYGSSVVSAEGEQTSGSGMCRVLDDSGDLWNIWWTGTTSGDWGITNGTGKYDGASGGGTWANTTDYPDGKQMNSWTGSITMP
jgi:hypothetical protein